MQRLLTHGHGLDERAFESLVAAHRGGLLVHSYRMLGSAAELAVAVFEPGNGPLHATVVLTLDGDVRISDLTAFLER